MAEPRQGRITGFFRVKGWSGSRNTEKQRSKSNVRNLSEEERERKDKLKRIGEETRAACQDLEHHDSRIRASYSGTYMTTRCAPIQQAPEQAIGTEVVVVDSDTLDAAAQLHAADHQASIGILNMASDRHVGGGFLSGAPAQEESLCRRTTLYPCLLSVKDKCYPLSATAVLVSPNVLVFRTGQDDDFKFIAQADRYFLTVLSAAAIRNPKVHHDRFQSPGDRQLTATKIREILRAGYDAGCRQLVLGAFGCGAFHNPPKAVAEVFRDVLLETEFRCAFDKIVFAILDRKDVTYGKGQTNNLAVFREVMHSLGQSNGGGAIRPPAAVGSREGFRGAGA